LAVEKSKLVNARIRLYFKDREMSNRMTFFILIAMAVAIIFSRFFCNVGGNGITPKSDTFNKISVDTTK
jgi:ABC-type uncharacterized transport system permease subunit